jgi:hypothetical protein
MSTNSNYLPHPPDDAGCRTVDVGDDSVVCLLDKKGTVRVMVAPADCDDSRKRVAPR